MHNRREGFDQICESLKGMLSKRKAIYAYIHIYSSLLSLFIHPWMECGKNNKVKDRIESSRYNTTRGVATEGAALIMNRGIKLNVVGVFFTLLSLILSRTKRSKSNVLLIKLVINDHC